MGGIIQTDPSQVTQNQTTNQNVAQNTAQNTTQNILQNQTNTTNANSLLNTAQQQSTANQLSGQSGTNSNFSTQANPYAMQLGSNILGSASQLGQPGQVPGLNIAALTPQQLQALGNIYAQGNSLSGLTGAGAQYLGYGANIIGGSAMPISAMDVENFYNPMAGNVTRQMMNIFGQQDLSNRIGATAQTGGVGGDRAAVAQALMANQQGLAAGQTYAGLYQQALQAAQQQKQQQLASGTDLAALGPQAIDIGGKGLQAAYAAASVPQQLEQLMNQSRYNQMMGQYQDPFLRLSAQNQALAGLTGLGQSGVQSGTQAFSQYGTGSMYGTGSQSGINNTTSTGQQTGTQDTSQLGSMTGTQIGTGTGAQNFPAPSLLSQFAGPLVAGASFFKSKGGSVYPGPVGKQYGGGVRGYEGYGADENSSHESSGLPFQAGDASEQGLGEGADDWLPGQNDKQSVMQNFLKRLRSKQGKESLAYLQKTFRDDSAKNRPDVTPIKMPGFNLPEVKFSVPAFPRMLHFQTGGATTPPPSAPPQVPAGTTSWGGQLPGGGSLNTTYSNVNVTPDMVAQAQANPSALQGNLAALVPGSVAVPGSTAWQQGLPTNLGGTGAGTGQGLPQQQAGFSWQMPGQGQAPPPPAPPPVGPAQTLPTMPGFTVPPLEFPRAPWGAPSQGNYNQPLSAANMLAFAKALKPSNPATSEINQFPIFQEGGAVDAPAPGGVSAADLAILEAEGLAGIGQSGGTPGDQPAWGAEGNTLMPDGTKAPDAPLGGPTNTWTGPAPAWAPGADTTYPQPFNSSQDYSHWQTTYAPAASAEAVAPSGAAGAGAGSGSGGGGGSALPPSGGPPPLVPGGPGGGTPPVYTHDAVPLPTPGNPSGGGAPPLPGSNFPIVPFYPDPTPFVDPWDFNLQQAGFNPMPTQQNMGQAAANYQNPGAFWQQPFAMGGGIGLKMPKLKMPKLPKIGLAKNLPFPTIHLQGGGFIDENDPFPYDRNSAVEHEPTGLPELSLPYLRQKQIREMGPRGAERLSRTIAAEDPSDPIAQGEEILNRAAARDQSVERAAGDRNFYPPRTLNFERTLDQLAAGSNKTNFATDNASGNVSAGQQTYVSPSGERYGRANQPRDRAWIQSQLEGRDLPSETAGQQPDAAEGPRNPFGRSNSPSGNFANRGESGLPFGLNPNMAMLRAGLGMMAASGERDRHGLPLPGLSVIGKGGIEGMKALDEQHKGDREDAKLALDAKMRMMPYLTQTMDQKVDSLKPVPMGQDDYGYTKYGVRDPRNPGKFIDPVSGQPIGGVQGEPAPAAGPPEKATANLPDHVDGAVLEQHPKDAATIRGIAEGRIDMRSIPIKMRGAINRWVQEYDPTWNQAMYMARSDMQRDLTPKGNSGKLLLAVNQVLPHINTASEKAEALENSGYPAANTVKNWWATATGDPRVKEFNAVKEVAAIDTARLLRGSGQMAEKDIEFWRQNIADSGSPKQLQGVFKMLSDDLIGARVSSIEHAWRTTMKTEPPDLVSKEAKDAVLKVTVRANKVLGEEKKAKTEGPGPGKKAPSAGDVIDGYRFKGGDPSKKENWERN